jgi:hypothetical protein
MLLFDGVEELDAVGPWEVLGAWAQEHADEAELVAFAAARAGAWPPMACACTPTAAGRMSAHSTWSCTRAGWAPGGC